jgi:DNA (cytosine-5)-methyltransferase 1
MRDKKGNAMKYLSLFSGIGGADLAAEAAGMEIVAFSEIDPFCCKVLAKHWPDVPNLGDIHKITKEGFSGGVDVICGGFPCQPFSGAGKRGGKKDDRHLWPEMFRVIQEFRPSWVVGENVAGFVSLGLDDALADLEAAGYQARAFVLPACAAGAHHRRDRCFIVAHLDSVRQPQPQGGVSESKRRAGNSPADVSDTFSVRLQGCSTGQVPGLSEVSPQSQRGDGGNGGWGAGQAQPRMVRGVHGFSAQMDTGRLMEVPPLATGKVKCRAHRVKALGNAIVPQQIFPIFKAIMLCEYLAQTERNSNE